MRSGLEVLVVGLGEAGIAVVGALVRQEPEQVRIRLFDTSPVTAGDVGPFFTPADVGQMRSDVVAKRLANDAASPRHAVSGSGNTATEIEAALAACLHGVDVALVCVDLMSPLRQLAIARCRSARTPLVAIHIEDRGGVVGPLQVDEERDVALGCPECAQAHREDRDPALAAARAGCGDVSDAAGWRHGTNPSAMAILGDVALLAACEAVEAGRGERPANARVVTLDFGGYGATVEPVSKHHQCRSCYPSSFAGDARSLLQDAAAWLRDIDAQRDQRPVDLSALHPRLRAVTGERYGLFRSLMSPFDNGRGEVWKFFRNRGVNPRENPLANAHAAAILRTSLYARRPVEATSVGFDFASPRVAESLALIEGLERLYAMSYGDPGRVVRAAYARLTVDAFDPRDFPLYADWQYAQPEFPVRRFDPEETIRWVAAVDMREQRPILVPHDLVYDDGAAAAIYRANSNGAACHTSLRQAIVNAIYEYVERDAFLVAWLDRLARPRVGFSSADVDPWSIRSTLERLDLQLEHVDISTDIGIPVSMGVLRDRRDPDVFLIDMVASLDARRRIGKLYRELAQFLYPYLVSRTHYVTERTQSDDPDSVRTFADHAAFYQSASRNALASFLTASPEVSPFRDDMKDLDPPAERDELDVLLHRLSIAGMRVLVVDCTVPLLRQLGLHAVRVLIPGLLPLNADHRLRVLAEERLRGVPRHLRVAGPQRIPADLNPWPHPFW